MKMQCSNYYYIRIGNLRYENKICTCDSCYLQIKFVLVLR